MNWLDYTGDVKYPEVTAKLVGENGNAFNLIAIVVTALKRAGVSKEEIQQFQKEAMSGDYDNLLMTCAKWVNVI